MYKCIIFDVDGTIINSEETIIKSLKLFTKKYLGMSLPDAEYSKFIGVATHIIFQKLNIPQKNTAEALCVFNDISGETIKQIKTFEGIIDLIKNLYDNKYYLAIVTSRNQREFEEIKSLIDFEQYFSCIVTVEHTKKHKPNPDPLHYFMDLSGFLPEEILYIGDSINDYLACRAVNIDFALAEWGCLDDFGINNTKYRFPNPNIASEII